MSGNIFKYDPYMLRKFRDKEVDCFIDIGANKGTTSIMARVLYPFSKVLAFEPHDETYEILCKQAMPWGIKCYREALGSGEELWFRPGGFSGAHRFVDKETLSTSKKKYDLDERTYPLKSILLSDLFKKYKIRYKSGLKYIIKMDCEGAEKYLVGDDEAVEIIKMSMMTSMEVHYNISLTYEEWEEWFGLFTDTHTFFQCKWVSPIDEEVTRTHYICDSIPKGRAPEIVMLRNDFL